MKAILVQPKIGYMDALRSAPGLPLGLLFVAAGLKDCCEVDLIDARLAGNLEARLQGALTDDTLFVGVTCHTGPMIRDALRVSRLVKRFSEVPVVWGGVHASLAPEVTLADPDVDICVIGEGEITALELARALSEDRPLESVPGLAFKRGGKVIRTAQRELLSPREWPEPAFQLVDLSRYLPVYNGRPSLFFQASRGCPNRCTYCYNTTFNRRRFRKRPAETVIASIERLLEQAEFRDVYFVDDNFLVDTAWAQKIAKGLCKMGLSWQMQGVEVGTLMQVDDNYIRQLREMGCERLTIGVETGSDRMRRMIGKQGTRQDVVQTIGRFAGTGIIVFTSYIVCFPHETREEIKKTVELALELVERYDFVRCSPFYCFSPYPGTAAFDEAVDAGFHMPGSLEEWSRIGGMDDFTWQRRTDRPALSRADFEGLNLTTLFLDKKVNDYSSSVLMDNLAALYRPLARLRTRNMFFKVMPERWLLKWFLDRYVRSG